MLLGTDTSYVCTVVIYLNEPVRPLSASLSRRIQRVYLLAPRPSPFLLWAVAAAPVAPLAVVRGSRGKTTEERERERERKQGETMGGERRSTSPHPRSTRTCVDAVQNSTQNSANSTQNRLKKLKVDLRASAAHPNTAIGGRNDSIALNRLMILDKYLPRAPPNAPPPRSAARPAASCRRPEATADDEADASGWEPGRVKLRCPLASCT